LELDRLGIGVILAAELTLQDLQHTIFQLSLDDRLYLAPIPEHIQSVLDVGTGTGLWAQDFGAFVELSMPS
jgi:hypothetical protein